MDLDLFSLSETVQPATRLKLQEIMCYLIRVKKNYSDIFFKEQWNYSVGKSLHPDENLTKNNFWKWFFTHTQRYIL